ncbi:hypothetical protein BJ508DRAFT_112808 [Ascobolus immersus RN42]|uniref:Uncharacterized protein n=1 Tax=Ascobolus immersus RN42 TaxID=1160509 RepID=A0A3N4I607_ASCIM|nr:hypothetical protein BJ508DRAFT_112808 [Ascobolus immersus RN42]
MSDSSTLIIVQRAQNTIMTTVDVLPLVKKVNHDYQNPVGTRGSGGVRVCRFIAAMLSKPSRVHLMQCNSSETIVHLIPLGVSIDIASNQSSTSYQLSKSHLSNHHRRARTLEPGSASGRSVSPASEEIHPPCSFTFVNRSIPPYLIALSKSECPIIACSPPPSLTVLALTTSPQQQSPGGVSYIRHLEPFIPISRSIEVRATQLQGDLGLVHRRSPSHPIPSHLRC